MMDSRRYSSDIAFTDTVKALQRSKGSRRAYERMEENGSWESTITPDLRAFVAALGAPATRTSLLTDALA